MRAPNPWITIPTLLAAIGGGIVGYLVTEASCRPSSCVPLATSVSILAGTIAAAGVGVVLVLAMKSLAEWRDHADREIVTDTRDPDGPPTC